MRCVTYYIKAITTRPTCLTMEERLSNLQSADVTPPPLVSPERLWHFLRDMRSHYNLPEDVFMRGDRLVSLHSISSQHAGQALYRVVNSTRLVTIRGIWRCTVIVATHQIIAGIILPTCDAHQKIGLDLLIALITHSIHTI